MDFEKIIQDELEKNNIQDVKICKNGQSGAVYYDGSLKIPRPVDFITFGYCFHEIGHYVLGHCDKKSPSQKKLSYVQEYEAEQYAIQKLKEYDYFNRDYEVQAIRYVLESIAQAKNRGHNINKIPKEIVKWTGMKINKWKKAKKVFVSRGQMDVKNKKDLKIKFLFESEKYYTILKNK